MHYSVGTAGWSIPSQLKDRFPAEGSHLQRYAKIFNAVEINSSFYRQHKYETYFKWSANVPEGFRFSAKLLRYFTQEKKLQESGSMLRDVLQNMSGLSDKWCVLLVQLPPRLEFDLPVAEAFISDLRKYCHRGIVWEPRHPSWGSADARQLLVDYRISKVLADPEPCPISKIDRSALEEVRYFRLHGSPEIYKSRYSAETISRIAQSMTRPVTAAAQTWCIFDNTTFGFATENAKEILDLVGDKNY